MFKKILFKIFRHKKSILFLILFFITLHFIVVDFEKIKKFTDKKNITQEFYELRRHFLNLFFSIFGKILILILIFIIYLNFKSHFEIKKLKNRLSLWSKLSYYVNQIGEEVFEEFPIGIILIDIKTKEIQWINNYSRIIFNNPSLNIPVYDLNKEMAALLNSGETQRILTINQENFDCLYKKEFSVFYLFNVTEREKIKKLYYQQTPTVIFLSFDNFENSLKNCDLSEQSQIKVEYLSALSDFFDTYENYLKQLSDDKFLLLLNRQQLDKIVEDKFSILKTIRDISNKYKLKITLSIGVACYNLPYNKIATLAQNAIELAQRRGGDQAVVNIEGQKIKYFGATTTTLINNSKVISRVNAEIIQDLVQKHHSCFIIGHIYPDLDSFSSMIAFYQIASTLNNNFKHYLVLDEEELINPNFKTIYSHLKKEEPKIVQQIINVKKTIKMIDNNALLVILDTQSKNIFYNQELLNLTSHIIIIDHHRATEEIIPNIFSYVDSLSSSTVEILIELIAFFKKEIVIPPLVASLMYGGIVIDTNYFTYRTTSRTLEAAAKLVSIGADGSLIKFWLREELSKIQEINELISKMEVYKEKYAIMKSEIVRDNRTFLAKVSENALNIHNISAAFTIGKLQENKIGISARSYNDVNVQVIMEQMGGGGHINSAATQIEGNNIEEVVEKLKNILSIEYKEGLKNMKIILLEDIPNKGKKNDIIEINLGYGNFLIKERKALLANASNIKKIEKEKKIKEEQDLKHMLLMKQLKKDIDDKQITLTTPIGPQGRIYGKITLKQIINAFYKEHNIFLNKKKLVLDSEINSLGKYKANVVLTKDIVASFIINVESETIDKK
ncbi:MAG: 50S ribosomal protein L9 [Vigna little leaf phytoplasma]|nr:50S ribosomal protein L9 [Vigna little leaf phytoplasma]